MEKPEAYREWGKLLPSKELQEKIIAAVKKWKVSREWKEDGGKYIVYPERFLKRRKWEDEVVETTIPKVHRF